MDVAQDRSGQSTGRLVVRFQAQLDRSAEICDLLEALADDLPKRSRAVWRAAKLQCQNVLNDHFALCAEQILPRLLLSTQNTQFQRNVFLWFQVEYSDMARRAEDLNDLLYDAVAHGPNSIGAEALGYALRGHFEALRNIISSERAILEPMIAQRLEKFDPPNMLAESGSKASH